MEGTIPHLTACLATSLWLQWLMGRSLSSGASQASAIIAQICSGVNLPGAPERAASLKRSAVLFAASASRQRLRHTPSRRAVSLTPSAARRMIRARSASFCGVECARSKLSSSCGCCVVTSRDAAILPAILASTVRCDGGPMN